MGSFIEGSILGVPAGGPSSWMKPAIFFNTYSGEGMTLFPSGSWITVDVSHLVPHGAKAVFLSGILIITHGTLPGTADLTAAFRSVGETTDYAYVFQAIEAHLGGGQRSTAGTWVALENGKFEFKWMRNTVEPYPAGCAYLMNLRVTAYIR